MSAGFTLRAEVAPCFLLTARCPVYELRSRSFRGATGIHIIHLLSSKGAINREHGQQKGLSEMRLGIEERRRVMSGLCATNSSWAGELRVFDERESS
jgi:hypothetical protein